MSLKSTLEGAYAGRSVLVTGHTGFKGGWLTVWLSALGARVAGLSLPALPDSVFSTADISPLCRHHEGDLRELATVEAVVARVKPDIVFHLAAQALVRTGFEEPVATLTTNVTGTAHVLEAVRRSGHRCAVVVVSSDKCYENREWVYGYREQDALGGADPYSMSKAGAELVTAMYRAAYFPPLRLAQHGVAVASARAGNVIGGGDWAPGRLVPDCIRALSEGRAIPVRTPRSTRPWQHVVEPLGGYLLLGHHLLGADAAAYCEPWNFGPPGTSERTVAAVVEELIGAWGSGTWVEATAPHGAPEAALLRLSIDKATARLGWAPRWSFEGAVARTATWYRAQLRGASPGDLRALMLKQLDDYQRG